MKTNKIETLKLKKDIITKKIELLKLQNKTNKINKLELKKDIITKKIEYLNLKITKQNIKNDIITFGTISLFSDIVSFKENIKNYIISFDYTKKDGSYRHFEKATMNKSFIKSTNSSRSNNEKLLTNFVYIWDIEDKSFKYLVFDRIYNVKIINKLK